MQVTGQKMILLSFFYKKKKKWARLGAAKSLWLILLAFQNKLKICLVRFYFRKQHKSENFSASPITFNFKNRQYPKYSVRYQRIVLFPSKETDE